MANQLFGDMEFTPEEELAAIFDGSQQGLNIDIDQTLNDKAVKNQLTKTNVKNLIKNVLMNDDVATMLRQTLDENTEGNCLYEPKLTRAKIREMLKNYPPPVQWSPNQQESIISECRLLIEKEFPDDSEDEEYRPDKTLDEDDDDEDDDEPKCVELNKSFGTESENDNYADIKENKTGVEFNNETIGMRTRSKLSLNDTPLEMIEQAFIPPDITEDMYDSACENDEWMEFLSEFTKPLESVQNDDNEDDPEYNVLCDDDLTNVDKEEFRIDKSVKITRKEYNALMNELNEFTNSYIEFNGGFGEPFETIETNTVTTERDNDKNVNKSKNSSTSTPVYPSNDSNWESNSSCTMNDKSIDKTTNNCSSIPVYSLNYSDWKSNVTYSTSDDIQMTDVVNFTTPLLEKQSNTSQLNHHDQSVEKQLAKNDDATSLTTNVLHFEPITEQLDSNILNVNGEINSIFQRTTVNYKNHGMTSKQIILFKHQLTQHVQLITQSYLLCTLAKQFKIHLRKLKNMLEVIKNISKDKQYIPINIYTSFKFILDWTEFQKDEIKIKWNHHLIPSYIKEFMLLYKPPVFIYPHLLPPKTYSLDSKTSKMAPSEEKVFIYKIDHVYNILKKTSKYKMKTLNDMMPTILDIVQKRWFSHRRLTDLKILISRQKFSNTSSPLKNYLTDKKIEDVSHVVDIVNLFHGKYLYDCDVNKFPVTWKQYVKKYKLKI